MLRILTPGEAEELGEERGYYRLALFGAQRSKLREFRRWIHVLVHSRWYYLLTHILKPMPRYSRAHDSFEYFHSCRSCMILPNRITDATHGVEEFWQPIRWSRLWRQLTPTILGIFLRRNLSASASVFTKHCIPNYIAAFTNVPKG